MLCRRFDLVNKNILRLYNTDGNLKSANIIRKEFLDYFLKDHSFVRSSSVLNLNDPSTPFVNAGMNQFKGIFLGLYDPPFPRVANSQRCIRVGGKHNDLQEVGLDTYHHTFFEMLGNWSFGDYSKEEACKYAWNLLTDIYKINKDLLYVTYFAGDEKLGLGPDLECKDIWLRLGVPEKHILAFGAKDNFWEMASTGPCGVCTEIHISENINKPVNLIELWNIVFIQNERLEDGRIISLPKQHVDTGMGFERLVAVLQGKKSNYDTDLFVPLFRSIEKYAKAPQYKGTFVNDNNLNLDTGYRILADHARMITVALADGTLPDKNQKLRRVLRKALDLSEKLFNKSSLVHELTFHVADSLGETYPELHKNIKQVQHIIDYELDTYTSLKKTCGKKWKEIAKARPELCAISEILSPGLIPGYQDLQSFLASGCKNNTLSGEFAFRLYDTHGLNVDTISELAKIEKLKFDISDFEKSLNMIKARSKARTEGKLNKESITELSLDLLEKLKIPKTDDSLKYNCIPKGERYSFPIVKSKLLALIIKDNLKVSPENNKCLLTKKELLESEVYILVDKTPFYVNEGGQAFDKGFIQIKGLLFDIFLVKKIRGFVFHVGRLINNDSRRIPLKGLDLNIRNEEPSQVWINSRRRLSVMRNHTATHLLNAALRKVLPSIQQSGSYVERDKLSFECSLFGQKLTKERVEEVENLVNNCIECDVPVRKKVINMSEMMTEDDLTIIPGENYPMTGIRITDIDSLELKSKEACCGTHVHRIGVLDHFRILHLKSQGKISVTIEAVAGPLTRCVTTTGEKFKKKLLELEKKLEATNSKLDEIDVEINYMKRNLTENQDKRIIAHNDYRECQEKIVALEKLILTMRRGDVRNNFMMEINKVREMTNLPYVIVTLKVSEFVFDELPLRKLELMSDIPILVIATTETRFKARCVVSKKLCSESFNSRIWMKPIMRLFNAKSIEISPSDSYSKFGTNTRNLPQGNAKEIIDKAINEVKEIANSHLQFLDKMKINET